MATYYSPKAVTDDLVFYVDISNIKSYARSGTLIGDLTQATRSASLFNGPVYTGSGSGYISFDGVNDHIITSDLKAPFGNSGIISHFAWVYPTAAGNIVSELGAASLGATWHDSNIEINTGGVFSISTWHGGLNNKVVANAVPFEYWYYVGFTYDGSNLTGYINGERLGSVSITRSVPYIVNSSNGLHYSLFASDSTNMGTNAYAAGRFGSFAVYKKALTPGEVLQNYYATRSKFPIIVPTQFNSSLLVLHFDAGNSGSYTSGSSIIYDLSTQSNTGSLQGSPTYTGSFGGTFNLDGVDDYISTTTAFSAPSKFTLSVWFRTTSTSGTKIIGLESSQTGVGSSNYDRHLYVGTDGKLVFGQFAGGFRAATSTTAVNDGIWHNAVTTYGEEGNIMRLYVDGVSVATQTADSPSSYTGYYRIGAYKLSSWSLAADGYFSGSIGIVKVLHRAVSSFEIVAEYNATKGRFGL